MLATAGSLPVGSEWAFEFKWDGVRALAVLHAGRARLYARSGAEITAAYPELAGLAQDFAGAGVTDAVLDGEIVSLDAHGRPSFPLLAERMHVRDLVRAQQLAASHPVTYMIFDVLEANGTDIRTVQYGQRREWLEGVVGDSGGADDSGDAGDSSGGGWPGGGAGPAGGPARWLVPPRFTDGEATAHAARELALEGVVAKRVTSVYRSGARSPDWVKVKHERTGDYVVGGWRPGRRTLGALLVGAYGPGGRLRYRGRVGGGISDALERDLLGRLHPMRAAGSPFDQPLPAEDARGAVYVAPDLVVEVRYGQLTPDGRLRFPRLVRLRPDKEPEETVDE
jgi:bifunctional non-homologous end joining protein LigD